MTRLTSMPHEADRIDARPGVVDAGRQLVRRKPAEHHRMHRADPGAGQHRDRRLRHHRHVDQHAVALADPEPGEHAGDPRRPVAQLAIGEALDRAGDRAVPDQRDALAASGRDMAVERVPAGVEPRAGEPAVERRPAVVEHPVPAPLPIDRLRRLGPEFLGPLQRAAIGLGIARHRHRSLERGDLVHSISPIASRRPDKYRSRCAGSRKGSG